MEQPGKEFIENWKTEMIERVKTYFLANGNVPPRFYYLHLVNGQLVEGSFPIHVMWRSDEDKDRMAHVIRTICKRVNVQALIFATEAWFVIRDEGFLKNRPKDFAPSQQPDRIEVLWFTYESVYDTLYLHYKILRDGGTISFEPLSDKQPTRSEGRFVNLLKKPQVK